MKHLQTYESFAGDIARYNPKRMKNDHKFVDLHREILEDSRNMTRISERLV